MQAEFPEIVIEQPKDMTYEVEEALNQLKDTYRQVVVLRYIENFSTQETSEILGWSETKVRTTAHRALIRLREILGAHSEEV
ncbi:RNA polymerase sigma factor [Alicyclobacillus suci]|uniref:RNA polymerase sigma factor n=1 Tax=Alicyclobacillus suci TaxID=2816080 RepID=UPI001F2DE072|nr:RNA polymerase sigma factor [Alicyclobacillus suci]